MPLIDTSAWIEYLRKTGSETNIEMRNVLTRRHHICDAVTMEILSGARDDINAKNLKRLLSRATVIETKPIDYHNAATIYRACRQVGLTVRTQIDCLIAAIAIRTSTPLLHQDSDFTAISQITKLKLHTASK
ncbi:MAG: type II toxin-antitoxin system VapC family toxin [Ilumatobacteraceae bacterium]